MTAFLGEIILIAGWYPPAGYVRCDGQLLPIGDQYDALFTLIGTIYGGDGENNFAVPDLRSRVPIHKGPGPGLTSFFIGEFGGAESVNVLSSQIPSHTHAIDVSSMTATARCASGNATTTSPVGALPAKEAAGAFTDSALIAGVTPAKAAHIIELRSRIDAARVLNGLPAFAYADTITPATTMIRVQHILDLRTALAQVHTQLNLTQPSYTDPQLSAGQTLKAVHISELRSAVLALGATGNALRFSDAASDSNLLPSAIAVSGSPAAMPSGGNQPHNNMQPFLTIMYCIAVDGVYPQQN